MNSVVAFECAEGFELKGSSFRKCQLNGEWDGEPAQCQGVWRLYKVVLLLFNPFSDTNVDTVFWFNLLPLPDCCGL